MNSVSKLFLIFQTSLSILSYQKSILTTGLKKPVHYTLTYWLKQNACLNKILETKPATFNEFKQAINSLLELSSLNALSKNEKLADDYFKVKSKRLKKKIGRLIFNKVMLLYRPVYPAKSGIYEKRHIVCRN